MKNPFLSEAKRRENFIADMNQKWKQKYQREQAWLDRIDELDPLSQVDSQVQA